MSDKCFFVVITSHSRRTYINFFVDTVGTHVRVFGVVGGEAIAFFVLNKGNAC